MEIIEPIAPGRMLARTLCTEISFAELEQIGGAGISMTGCPGSTPPKGCKQDARLISQSGEVSCSIDDHC